MPDPKDLYIDDPRWNRGYEKYSASQSPVGGDTKKWSVAAYGALQF